MMLELALRFAVGGAVVSLFAACGEVVRPKTFAGMFGAAPSVAMATLAIAFAKEGVSSVAWACRAMMIGSLGLIVYSAACVWMVRRKSLPVGLGAALGWLAWFATTFATRGLIEHLGGGA